MSANGKHARLHASGVPLIDSFQFAGPNVVPGTVDLDVRWDAVGPQLVQGSGSGVDPSDPAAFLGNFAQATAVGDFAGSDLGFSFRSDPGASSDLGYAEIGTEQNGQFL